jgi:hypothetical protein
MNAIKINKFSLSGINSISKLCEKYFLKKIIFNLDFYSKLSRAGVSQNAFVLHLNVQIFFLIIKDGFRAVLEGRNYQIFSNIKREV